MAVGIVLGTSSEEEEQVLAQDLEEEVRRHGGSLDLNFLLICRPDLRKRLGDARLLRFVERFPELFAVRAREVGGHVLHCRTAPGAGPSNCGERQLPAILRAEAGASLPRAALGGSEAAAGERAVHALRQLERDVLQRLAAPGTATRPAVAAAEPEAAQPEAKDVAWLLRNGKIRRRIGGAQRYHPIPELIVRSDEAGPDDPVNGGEEFDGGEEAAEEEQPVRHRCPVSAQSRTTAGYLMQFLRDRPGRFLVAPSRSLGTAEFAVPAKCIYGDPVCSCAWEVSLVPEAAGTLRESLDDEDSHKDVEHTLVVLARRCYELARATGSVQVPMARLGRDRLVHEALRGRSLLQLLEQDSDRRAARGLARRFIWNSYSSAYTVGVQDQWLAELGLGPEGAAAVAGATASAGSSPPDVRRNRRLGAGLLEVQVLAEGAGVIVVLKPAGPTTEAMLEALQAQCDAQHGSGALRIISVSRLDRDTSGVLVAATSQAGADCLTEQFKEHTVFKQYLALAVGRVEPRQGEVRARLYISDFSERYRAYVSPKGKEACTRYDVLESFTRGAAPRPLIPIVPAGSCTSSEELQTPLRYYYGTHRRDTAEAVAGDESYSLLACYPITGRTHQIRAHLEWRGHPLVADTKYAPKGQFRQQMQWCRRLFLHCRRMRVRDLAGCEIAVEAPLPGELHSALDALRPGCEGGAWRGAL